MADPAEHRGPPLSDDKIAAFFASLGKPAPISVEPFLAGSTGFYHGIYFLRFAASTAAAFAPSPARGPDGAVELVLRVSGSHLPHIKTANEVGVMRWVREHTRIPIPAVVAFDASPNNLLGAEYTLLERVPGVSADRIYPTLDAAAMERLVEQLVDIVAELHAKKWKHIGGLVIDEKSGEVVPGPVIDETFWHDPDIVKYWGPEETSEQLNVAGPYGSYTEFTAAHMERYIYAMEKHPTLAWMRALLPRLRVFVAVIESRADELDRVPHILAHKDLHFANVMCDPATLAITAILDWEFSTVVPAPRWNPVKAFLWSSLAMGPEAMEEKYKLVELAEAIARRKGLGIFEEVKPTSAQEDMQVVASYVRALVEVGVRGQKADLVQGWMEKVEEALTKLGA